MGEGGRDFLKEVVACVLSHVGPPLVGDMCRHGSFERILIFLTESSPIALIMVMMMMMGDCLKFYEYSLCGA